MKLVLAALCGIIVLFMGGCSILTLPAFPLTLVPGAIVVLNLSIIGALYGWKLQWLPAFYVLGIVDLLLAVGSFIAAPAIGTRYMWVAAAIFGVKGVLSLFYAGRSRDAAP